RYGDRITLLDSRESRKRNCKLPATETLQSQVTKTARKRLSLRGLEVLHGRQVRVSNPKRIYLPRIICDHVMVQEDFERLHKFLLETEGLSEVSDDMRQLIEQEWPELVHKLPPKTSSSGLTPVLPGADKDRADNCSPNCC